VRVAARKAFRRGATQLKVMVSGGVISLTDELDHTQLTVEELRAAVVEAEARNTYVTAHAHNSRGIRNGLAAGVACFEHGSWLDEETAAAMAAAGAALVPTLTVAHVMAEGQEEFGDVHTFEDNLEATVRWYREHEAWWRPLKKEGGYRKYYQKQYAAR